VSHRELVDGVIDGFLEENVDAVLGVGAIAETPNIHAGPQPDVFEGRKGLD
jgi:hypothetical protein